VLTASKIINYTHFSKHSYELFGLIKYAELDEMHSYIGNKKTTAGFGLLLIDLEKNSSTSLLATEATQQPLNSGIK